jgi:hypothetical protein
VGVCCGERESWEWDCGRVAGAHIYIYAYIYIYIHKVCGERQRHLRNEGRETEREQNTHVSW